MTVRLALSVLLLAAVAGCDRAVVEPLVPSLVVESPDLGEVLTQSKVTLRVRAQRSDEVVRVRIAGIEAPNEGDAFTASLTLTRGLTAIPLEGLDADGAVIVRDTAYALLASPATQTAPPPQGLAGGGALSATTLPSGHILLAGGEPAAGAVRADATVLRPIGESLEVVGTVTLQETRYSHTATLLPDGSVLLLGGATRRTPRTPGDFVQFAELVLPEGQDRGQSQTVLFQGPNGFQRSGHVTRLIEVDGQWILFLIGGVVAGDPPRTTPTIDVLRFEPGAVPRLTVLTPPGGAGAAVEFDAPDPLLLDIRSAPTGRASSWFYGLAPSVPISAQLVWAPPGPPAYPVGVNISGAVTPLAKSRTGAASAALSGGLYLVSGGRNNDGATLASIEAIVPIANRAFDFGAVGALRRARSGHAATSLGPGRMLTIGGYNEGGFAILDLEITTL